MLACLRLDPKLVYEHLRALHQFKGPANSDAGLFTWGVLEGGDGILYGNSANGLFNRGTVYRVSKDGTICELIYNFKGFGEDEQPAGQLVEGPDGALYGTCGLGGLTSPNSLRGGV